MTIHGSDHYANGEERFDAEGRKQKFLYNGTGSDTAIGTTAKLGYSSTIKGLQAQALADSATIETILVAAEVITSTSYGWFYKEGSGISATVASMTVTAGDGLSMSNGAFKDTGTGFARSDNEFGVIETSASTTTSIVITLLGRESLGAT